MLTKLQTDMGEDFHLGQQLEDVRSLVQTINEMESTGDHNMD